MFGRAIWDKLPERIFENLEIVRVRRGQFQNFQNREGCLSQNYPEPNIWLLVNHTKNQLTLCIETIF